jgi:hypothetical protein
MAWCFIKHRGSFTLFTFTFLHLARLAAVNVSVQVSLV